MRPVIIHACETWVLKQAIKQKLLVFTYIPTYIHIHFTDPVFASIAFDCETCQ